MTPQRTTKGKRTGQARGTKAKAKVRAGRTPKVPITVPDGWTVDKGGKAISLHLKTKDFLDALAVMNEVAQVAEDLEHHPDFHLERWNHLRITTYSHDEGKLTDRDERLAQRVGEVVAKRGLEPQRGPGTTGRRQG